MTLLQAITQFIEGISVTDRQEESIKCSLENINEHLLKEDNDLNVERTFTNGSYERDTIIRPLNDIDLFAVLKKDEWQDDYGQLPKPQKVLTKLKTFLNNISEYKDKVKQDRPCVTLELSDKDFDVLPCLELTAGGYMIPNYDLSSWTYTYPEQLSEELESINSSRNYKIKPVIKAIKYWNRQLNKLIPSYHIEEVAISVFTMNSFSNLKEGIQHWFYNAEYYLQVDKFKSDEDYKTAVTKVKDVATSIKDAQAKLADGKEAEAIQLWKEVFGRDFPTIDPAEAKTFSKAIVEGGLKVASTGILSTSSGFSITASKGYYGDVSKS